MLLAILMVERPALCRFETGKPMSPITGIRGSIISAAGGAPRQTASAPRDKQTSASRALIPLQPVAPGDTPLRTRPQAAYLAHLIATKDKVPQTRERRRAEPAAAIAVYAAANAGAATPSGTRLSVLM
jgi:hypothetical protein